LDLELDRAGGRCRTLLHRVLRHTNHAARMHNPSAHITQHATRITIFKLSKNIASNQMGTHTSGTVFERERRPR